MLALIAIVPWIAAVAALLFIIIKNNKDVELDDDMDDYDYEEKDVLRVAVYEDKAYWVYKNTFYESEVVREPDFTTARPIDTMGLAPKELEKLLSILDELEESNNERD